MILLNFLIFINIFSLFAITGAVIINGNCAPRDFGHGSVVCVCNSTYCDTLEDVSAVSEGTIVIVTSDKLGRRWSMEQDWLMDDFDLREDVNTSIVNINIDRTLEYQSILGFGGAFTDSTGFNLEELDQELREEILQGYFASDGLEYTIGRVPIGGSDFSTHPYSYDDLPHGQTDPDLNYFKLAQEDFLLKIPMIEYASEICKDRGVDLFLFGSPWSSPGWMKTNGEINGQSSMIKDYYPSWAAYIVKFLEGYKELGVEFDALTAQNEPMAALYTNYSWNSIGWSANDLGEWVSDHLGPQLHSGGFADVSVMIPDENRIAFPDYAQTILEYGNASAYVSAIAVHWYEDWLEPATVLDKIHQLYPDLPIIYTEACTGFLPWDLLKVILGSWDRAEEYAENILEDLNHWAVGWTDWNMALDLEGGPNWANNFVDSPVIVNNITQEAYRQPMFYALAHFSKIVPKGSVRLGNTVSGGNSDNLRFATFERPDGTTALIIMNLDSSSVSIQITDSNMTYTTDLGPRSIVSFLW